MSQWIKANECMNKWKCVRVSERANECEWICVCMCVSARICTNITHQHTISGPKLLITHSKITNSNKNNIHPLNQPHSSLYHELPPCYTTAKFLQSEKIRQNEYINTPIKVKIRVKFWCPFWSNMARCDTLGRSSPGKAYDKRYLKYA